MFCACKEFTNEQTTRLDALFDALCKTDIKSSGGKGNVIAKAVDPTAHDAGLSRHAIGMWWRQSMGWFRLVEGGSKKESQPLQELRKGILAAVKPSALYVREVRNSARDPPKQPHPLCPTCLPSRASS